LSTLGSKAAQNIKKISRRKLMFKSKFYAILLTATFIGGCGGMKTKAMQHSATNPIQSIALLTIATNDSYEYQEPPKRNTTIMGFNTGAIDQIKENVKDSVHGTMLAGPRIQLHLRASNYSISQSLANALKQQMGQKGISVIGVQINRRGHDLLGDYKKTPSAGADAILDVSAANVGFREIEDEVYPLLKVRVRLVSTRTREVLYQDTVSISDFKKSPLLANERHTVSNGLKGLLRQPNNQSASLDGAATTIAAYISSQLRP